MKLHKLHMVDVLVLVPEYVGRNALINSAFNLVRDLTKGMPLRFTLVSYPEMDPRFDLEYDHLQAKDTVVDMRRYMHSVADSYDDELMTYEGQVNHDPYEYLDSKKSFEVRTSLVQRWLEEEAADEWYEMNRPDFKFRSESTLGVLMNSYRHEDSIYSGPVAELNNVAVIQTANCEGELSQAAHIFMAYELLAAALRFLLGHDRYSEYEHQQGIGCMNDRIHSSEDVIRRIQGAQVCSKCINGLKAKFPRFDWEDFLKSSLDVLSEKQRNIGYLNESIYRLDLELVPNELAIVFEDIGVRIHLSAKEYALYHFLLEHPMGLSKQSVVQERKALFTYYANVRKALTDQIRIRINTLIDGWQYTNDLRMTVGKINEKFKEVENLPGMKGWMITRVGDYFRLQAKH